MNHLADFVLMYPDNIKVAIIHKQADRCLQKTGGGSSNHAYVSDPTCQQAMRHLLPVGTVEVFYGPKIAGKCNSRTLHNPEKWLEVIEITWKKYGKGNTATQIMVMRYQEGNTDMNSVARKLRISPQRCYAILDSIHRFVVDYAKGIGAWEVKTKKIDRLDEIMLKVIAKDRGIKNDKDKEKETIFTN